MHSPHHRLSEQQGPALPSGAGGPITLGTLCVSDIALAVPFYSFASFPFLWSVPLLG